MKLRCKLSRCQTDPLLRLVKREEMRWTVLIKSVIIFNRKGDTLRMTQNRYKTAGRCSLFVEFDTYALILLLNKLCFLFSV